jgi:2'-5' RNA ligase
MNDKGVVRAFLAIDLPTDLKDGIKTIQDRLKHHLTGIRWTRPEGIHLTLKFFGDIPEESIAEISPVAKKAAAGSPSLSLSVENLGVFPGVSRARVLWIGMDGDIAPLLRLQQEIDGGLEVLGIAREGRSFKPHLTLGRFRSAGDARGLDRVLEKRNNYRAGIFKAEGLTLFKSDLRPEGAVYTVLAYFPFTDENTNSEALNSKP